MHYFYALLGGLLAGIVNAIAGGGTLISFPILMAIGIPAVSANMTNAVGLVPGYLGATIAQKEQIKPQKARLYWLLPISAVGGVLGGWLLAQSGDNTFRKLIPWLLWLASALLALQDPLRAWLQPRLKGNSAQDSVPYWAGLPILFGAIYGGYFGAGLGVVLLAVLGVSFGEPLAKLNAIKQVISFVINLSAAIFFVFTGQVWWGVALTVAVGALLGGSIGGRIASRIPSGLLRWLVIFVGLGLGVVYFFR